MALKNYVLVCGGTGCESSKADEIFQNIKKEIEAHKLQDDVQVIKTGCFGFCEQGPIVKILPEESFYVQVVPEDAKEIVAEHIVKGREVKRLLYVGKDDKRKTDFNKHEIDFYQKQYRIVLRNCGVINPENIDEYIAREGYAALDKV
ncbi:MAG TPA: NAD(P)H-dependent oxidoreductase subunit E, partial [Spirochaetota bacterium]|nr:NAD(P)H-dependent oxidoreductase subunit E [Spirochaetota bacterium]